MVFSKRTNKENLRWVFPKIGVFTPQNGWFIVENPPLKIPWVWEAPPLFLVQHPDICAAIHGWLEVPFEQFVDETFRCCKHLPVLGSQSLRHVCHEMCVEKSTFFFRENNHMSHKKKTAVNLLSIESRLFNDGILGMLKKENIPIILRRLLDKISPINSEGKKIDSSKNSW